MSAQSDPPTPPPIPTSLQMYPDGVLDYMTGINITSVDSRPDYGFTGLMTVQQWTSDYYETVEPGATFLFPANDDPTPPPYPGTLFLNGEVTEPIQHIKNITPARHQMLCDLLSPDPHDSTFSQNFIGFSCFYPWYLTTDNVGYNSTTCNDHWFGQRELPSAWQKLVRTALSLFLPNFDPGQVISKKLYEKDQLALTLQGDGSVSMETLDAGNEAQLWSFIQVPQKWNIPWYYIVNPYQSSSGNFQLFGNGEVAGLTAAQFAADDVTGQWMNVDGGDPPYTYLVNGSGSDLVMELKGGNTAPGTIVQLDKEKKHKDRQMWVVPG